MSDENRDTTGGRPPKDCYAPRRAAPRARRVRALRELIYENCATTGGRPPEDCYAPVKPALFARRRAGGQ